MLKHAGKRYLQTAQLYRLVIFGLLALALGSVALGVATLVRDVTYGYLLPLTLIALIMSWWLASGQHKTWKSNFMLILSGVVFTFLWVGRILGMLLTWFGTIPDLLWQALQRSGVITPEIMGAFQASWAAVQLQVSTQFSDLGVWFRSLLAGKPAFNHTASALIWGLAIWLVAVWAGWFQRRRDQSLIAILPGGALLLSVLGYTYGSTISLLFMLFATLMLVAVNHYILKEHMWKERSMDFPEAKRGDIFSRLIGLSFAFVLAAALIPRISITSIIVKVQAWVNPHLSQVDPFLQSFGLEQDTASAEIINEVISGGLPRQHLIDAGPELSEQVVMLVKLVDLTPAELEETIGPLYWRSHTYDRYTGRGWQTSPVTVQAYSADEETQAPTEDSSKILRQDFHLMMEMDFIYAAGEIISLDESYHLAWRSTPETADSQTFSGDFFAGTVQERAYRVTSQFPVASESELRDSAGVYPSWIAARYRALPNSLPARVTDLALELTRTAATPYDKARAIETYLRTFEYQLKLPDPPNNRDVVDTFLFELQKGYCDYYASAMVVMARAAGLPARLAVGYSRGTYDSTEQAFIITGEQAHTWAEIYFEGIGWVPFEPTAAQPEIIRPQQEWKSQPESESTPGLNLREIVKGWNFMPWLRWWAGILGGIVLLLGIWLLWDAIYLKYLPPSRLAITLFKRLYRYGSQLGAPSRVGDTPFEFATNLEELINSFNHQNFFRVPDTLRTFSQLYVRASFSHQPLTYTEKNQLLHLWPGLRRNLLRACWLYFWKGFQKKRVP